VSTYDPQRRTNRPKADEGDPAPVDDLLETAGPTPSATPAVESPPAPKPRWEDPSPGGGKGKVIGIGVAVTAVLFTLRWVLKRRKKD
jgi:hypothetical protein